MNLTKLQREKLSEGWHSRGYLPHFDGRSIPQFITLHLADSIPSRVIERWQAELANVAEAEQKLKLRKRVEKYLDMGYGQCFLKNPDVATIVQRSLLAFDRARYELFAWVLMPNHTHSLLATRAGWSLERIMHSHKSFTAHEANRALERSGQFWMKEYFDRYIRNAQHFQNTVRYIEYNPMKAGLCSRPEDWPFSSASFRKRNNTFT